MKVVIVDDHPLARRGIASILLNDDMKEIKEASNIEEAMNIITKDKPEMAMVDLRLGNENGLDIVVRTKEKGISTRFIVLTSFMSQRDFTKAEEMGVDGYVLKDAFVEDIIYAVNTIGRGKKYYDPAIFQHKDELESSTLINVLTIREKDVLKELGKGLSNDEIAKELYISEHTVKKHVSSILSKLNLNHRTQVVCFVNNLKV